MQFKKVLGRPDLDMDPSLWTFSVVRLGIEPNMGHAHTQTISIEKEYHEGDEDVFMK